MGSKINGTEEKEYLEEISDIVDNMSLMDDELMAKVFDENLPAMTLVLSTILQKEIEVERTKGQFDMRSPLIGGRSIRLDVHAKEKNGEHFDCEVQRANEGASPRRVRFHSAMLDTRMLKAGQSFDELKDSYVIFITENDYYGEGKPLYYVDRIVDDIICNIQEILLIGGDVASDFSVFVFFIRTLRRKIDALYPYLNPKVIFVLGNHELWSFPGEDKGYAGRYS